MNEKEILKKIKESRCIIFKVNYELDTEKMNKFVNQPLRLTIRHWKAVDIGAKENSINIKTKLKIEDEPISRYKIVLDFFINIVLDADFGETVRSELIEKDNRNLLFELFKLGIGTLKDAIDKAYEWMGLVGAEVSIDQLTKAFKELSQKESKIEAIH